MAREWAKKFYNSKSWQDTREAYFLDKHGICELCDKPGEEVHHKIFLRQDNIYDPDITVYWENLQLLCKTCHNVVHDKAYEMHRKKRKKNTATINGLCFDEYGNIVENKNVTIVYGAPASGKTTYVKENKGRYDIVIDIDYIMAALSLSDIKSASEDTLPFALDIRELMYELIAARKHYMEHAWVIGQLPKRGDRQVLQQRLNAEIIFIDTSKEECLARARADGERLDKEKHYWLIENYFKELEA